MPDLTIQGPNGEIITLESVNEVVEYLTQPLVPNSVQRSASKTKRKKKKEASSTEEANNTYDSHALRREIKTSNKKKKKKRTIQESLVNGHQTSDKEEVVDEDIPKVSRVRVHRSLHASLVAHQAGGYSGFCSMKRLGVFLLHPGWDTSPSPGLPPAVNSPVPIYTPGWREALTIRPPRLPPPVKYNTYCYYVVILKRKMKKAKYELIS